MLVRLGSIVSGISLIGLLSPAALAQASVSSITAAGSGRGPLERVAFVGDLDTNDVYELFVAPVDGSAPSLQLNPTLPLGGDVVSEFTTTMFAQVTGGRVLYVADQVTDELHELFSVRSDGSSPPVKLSGTLVTGGDVVDFLWKGRLAVYRADETVDNRRELYAVPLDGSAARTPLTPGLNVYRLLQLGRDGSIALFTTHDGIRERLYVVPTDASAAPLLVADSGTPVSVVGYTFFAAIVVSPDDVHAVVFAAEDDDSLIVGDIYSVRLDGSGSPIQLNQNSPLDYAASFGISTNGERVFFAEPDGIGFGSHILLQSVQMDGTGLVTLTPAGESTSGDNYRLTADGLVVFASVGDLGSSLYAAELDGSNAVLLLSPIEDTIQGLYLAPGDETVVCVSRGNSVRLFSLTEPNVPVPLCGNPPTGQDVSLSHPLGFEPIELTRDGKRVVFRADLDVDEVYELYSAPLDGSQPHVRLNPALSGGKDVGAFRLSADGKRVVYLADQTTNDVQELFSVPVDGSGAAVVVSAPPVSGGDALSFRRDPEPSKLARIP